VNILQFDLFCNNCGHEMSSTDNNFCSKCGKSVNDEKEKTEKNSSSSSKKIIIIAVVCSVIVTIGILAMFEIADVYTYDTYPEKQQHLLDLERDFDRIIGNYASDLGGQAIVICNQSPDYVGLVSCVYEKLPTELADKFERDTRGIRAEYDKTIEEMEAMLLGP